MPTRSVDFKATGGDKTEGGSDKFLVPAVGWSAPVNKDKTLFFGGGMFAVSGMGVDYDFIDTFSHPVMQAMGDNTIQKGRIYTQYQFWKMSPAFAMKFNHKLSLGFALNIDYQQMSFKQWFVHPKAGGGGVDLAIPGNAMGWGFSVGALYEVSDICSVGATYISRQRFENMKYRLQAGDIFFTKDLDPNIPTFYRSNDGVYEWSGMDFPQQFDIGVAIMPPMVNGLTIALDYKWIDFSRTYGKQAIKGNFNVVDLDGNPIGRESSFPLNFGWSDVNVYAINIQYQIGDSGWLRFGYNHGNSPIETEDVLNNMAFPAIVKDHYTVGGTKNLGQHWQLHGAYMHVNNETLTESGSGRPPIKISLKEKSFILGISYLF